MFGDQNRCGWYGFRDYYRQRLVRGLVNSANRPSQRLLRSRPSLHPGYPGSENEVGRKLRSASSIRFKNRAPFPLFNEYTLDGHVRDAGVTREQVILSLRCSFCRAGRLPRAGARGYNMSPLRGCYAGLESPGSLRPLRRCVRIHSVRRPRRAVASLPLHALCALCASA